MAAHASTTNDQAAQRLETWARDFEDVLAGFLAGGDDMPPKLAEAVRYAVQGGGKRIRPFVVTRMIAPPIIRNTGNNNTYIFDYQSETNLWSHLNY